MSKLATLLLAASLSVGCVSSPEHIELTEPPVSAPVPEPTGQAEICVVRPGIVGWIANMGVWVNDWKVGDIRSNDYILHAVAPGHVEVEVTAEADCMASFPVEANRRYYIRAVPKMGWWTARVQLEILEPEEGEEFRQKCEDQTYDEPRPLEP